ncbi:ribonuclease H-like domain-containing protein, partial [Gymnopilus junonius]
QIGWIMVDNAFNNDTMMENLEWELKSRGIPFDRQARHIQYGSIFNFILMLIKFVHWFLLQIRASSLHCEAFSKLAKEQFLHDLQLLHDMEVWWSSTFLMIECAIKCKPVILRFLKQDDFSELCQYELNDDDWDVLEAFLDILSIPHEFQQALSSEKTLTLCDTISHFNAIIQVWKEYQDEYPKTEDIVEAGIIKLQKYYDQILY